MLDELAELPQLARELPLLRMPRVRLTLLALLVLLWCGERESETARRALTRFEL